MITCVSGRSDRISRQASTPLPSGKRTSMITTSGWCSRTAAIEPATVSASPTTRKSPERSNNVRNPSRKTA